MKKFLSLILVALFILSIVSCGKIETISNKAISENQNDNEVLVEEVVPMSQSAEVQPNVNVTFVFNKSTAINGATYPANQEILCPIDLKADQTLSDIFGWENLKYVTKIEFTSNFSNTVLCKNQFRYCSGLQSVVIPNCVEEIGELAFGDCYSLKSVHFPANLKTIGLEAFFRCKSLESVDLSETYVLTIEANAFRYCESLKTVIFGKDINDWTRIDEIRDIEANHWNELTNQEKASINKEYASLMKNIKYLVIKGAAFQDCYSLEMVSNLQRNFQSFGSDCFQNDKNLATITYNWYYDYPNESFNKVETYFGWNYHAGNFVVTCLAD